MANGAAATCGAIVNELLRGTRDEGEWQRLERQLRGCEWLSMVDEDWFKAARLDWGLRRRGLTVPGADVLIAQIAMNQGVELLHADADFDRIAQYEPLKVESHVLEVRL